MGRKNRKPLPFFENIEISGLASEGKAITRVNDMVVFIPWGAPGDIVDIQIVSKRRNFMEARIIRFHHKSEIRTAPFCKHFSVCGGCKWQHLPYSEQLKQKQQQVYDAFERLGKFSFSSMADIIPSEKQLYYRNKLEFTFTSQRWLYANEIDGDTPIDNLAGLGFHIPGRFDKIIDVEHCYLQPDPSNSIRLFVKKWAVEHNISFWDVRRQLGVLRNLIIRNSYEGKVMVILVVSEFFDTLKHLFDAIADAFPEISSLQYVVNEKKNDDISDLDVILHKGDAFYIEKMGMLAFKVGPKSFYQTNSCQAGHLYNIVAELAGLTGKEIVYDLYTGTGTIACFVAAHCAKVIGVESIPEAIDNAKENAILNNLTNTQFFTGDMAKIFTNEFMELHGMPDVIIVDPPRAGMHPAVVEHLIVSGAEKIVYVSCNPATQARDITMLADNYSVAIVQPIDMFPHTHHVENVVLLEKIMMAR